MKRLLLALSLCTLLAVPRAQADSKAPTADLTDVFFTTSKVGYAVGKQGVAYRTADSGKTWDTLTTGVPIDLHSVYFNGPKIGWACGDNGLLLHTEDSGQTWTKAPLTGADEVTDTLRRIVFIGPENGWICGDHGILLHTEDEGKTWKVVPSSTRHNLEGMVWANSLEGWMVGGTTLTKDMSEGVILHTSDGGLTWLPQTTHLQNVYLHDVCFRTAKVGYVVGDTILMTTNGGRVWTPVNAGFKHGPLYSVAFDSPTHGWVGGSHGALYVTTDGGRAWTLQKSGTTRDILGIFRYEDTQVAVGSSPADKADAGTAVLRTMDAGRTWLH